MDDAKGPTKEKVREYMQRRQTERRQPPQGQDQIRRELGWDLKERRVRERRSGK